MCENWGPQHGGMLYYNFAAGSFHTKKLCSRLYSIKKNNKIVLWATLWGLRGNICTPSIAHWKAHGWLPICHNWTFIAISYGWDVISGNLLKSAFFERGVSLWAQVSDGRGRHPPYNHCCCQKTRVIVLLCAIKISPVHCLVLSQSTRVTDGRTDRITTPKTALA